jgi:hypothetical protein
MRINSSSSSSTKTTTTPKISEKSFNHSKKLENFWRISEKIFFSSSNVNQLSGSKKILHNSFWEIWHKISKAPGDVNIFNTSTFKTSNAPGDVHTNILENFVINAKPKPFSVNKRKKHTSIFRSSHQINTLKPTLITSLKKIDDPSHLVQHNHLVQSIATKRPQAWSSQFQLMYFSRKVEIDHFLLYLVRQNVPIRTGPDLFEINNNEAPNEEVWRHKLYQFVNSLCK